MRSLAFASFVILLTTSEPASAHHAFAAEFDAKQPVVLKGSVARMEWINPHAWIHIDVTGTDGKTTRWRIECGTPNALVRNGMTKQSIAIGTQVVVQGFRAKDGSNKANGRDVTLSDGRKLFLGSSLGNATR